MKIAVTGAGGQLGRELCNRGRSRGNKILPLTRAEFDITDRFKVNEYIQKAGPDLVVNAAAYTAVDRAESEPDRAFAINRNGPANLAAACAAAGIPLVHVSTDYVFDGSKSGPYIETDPVSPLGVYGRSKAAGEDEVRKRLPEHLIVRTAWLYGLHGHNFVKTMLRLGRENTLLKVVDDQKGCPTNAADLAGAIIEMAEQLGRGPVFWGTYHFCNQGEITWHGFALEIFNLARKAGQPLKVKEVRAITSAEYPTPVTRPANSVLDCSKLIENFDIEIPAWRESLARMMSMLPAEPDL